MRGEKLILCPSCGNPRGQSSVSSFDAIKPLTKNSLLAWCGLLEIVKQRAFVHVGPQEYSHGFNLNKRTLLHNVKLGDTPNTEDGRRNSGPWSSYKDSAGRRVVEFLSVELNPNSPYSDDQPEEPHMLKHDTNSPPNLGKANLKKKHSSPFEKPTS